MPDLLFPSQSQDITAVRVVPNYTAWWQRHVCEQLAQGRYLTVEQPVVELVTSRVASQRHNHYTTRPHTPPGHSLGKGARNIPKSVKFPDALTRWILVLKSTPYVHSSLIDEGGWVWEPPNISNLVMWNVSFEVPTIGWFCNSIQFAHFKSL